MLPLTECIIILWILINVPDPYTKSYRKVISFNKYCLYTIFIKNLCLYKLNCSIPDVINFIVSQLIYVFMIVVRSKKFKFALKKKRDSQGL